MPPASLMEKLILPLQAISPMQQVHSGLILNSLTLILHIAIRLWERPSGQAIMKTAGHDARSAAITAQIIQVLREKELLFRMMRP